MYLINVRAQWSKGVTKPISTFWLLLLMLKSENNEFSLLKPFFMSNYNFEIHRFASYGLD